ncbi:DUF4400 domain-containing protein [Aquabacterium sp. NJ1]|uniref:DUF4400 domain-containing protein n=1 Tax=Aquabacterium sp. NJ1 TaxID=1538295 RepID=UPI0006915ECF|nr:DUF4400 domain-containing protein [Aquabacterium sp. NJ1]
MATKAQGVFDGTIIQAFLWPFRTLLRTTIIVTVLLLWTIVTQCWFAYRHSSHDPVSHLKAVMGSDLDYAADLTPIAFSPVNLASGIGGVIQEYGVDTIVASARALMNTPTILGHKGGADRDLGKQYVDKRLMPEHGDKFKQWILASYIFGARIAIFLSMFPLLALLYVVSVVDGLSRRAIRRANAERESASIYHRAKMSQVWLLAVGLTAYLAIPYSLSPAFVLAPLAVILAYLARMQIASYKKYL